MEEHIADRRKEARYPVKAKVIVQKKNGETILATAVNISSSGMRLRFDQPCPLSPGEEVTVDVELRERLDKPFSAWGFGRVAHVDAEGAGIELQGGQFDLPLDDWRER
ncbi:MAG: PilZ domain-containing protein [Bryobacteraceae bacterium]